MPPGDSLNASADEVLDTAVAPIDLAARYQPGSPRSVLTGVQAIARQLVEQHERDRRAGKHTATFMSGYQGSPLGGLDKLIAGLSELRTDHDVHLVPAVNEELAATAVWGSQGDLPVGERTHDGIVGVWYGKGPGLDRATDAIRHATMYGANARGGVLAYVGDDPSAKSSSVPCVSERSLAALSIPVLFPRNAEEVIRFGLYGVELSRASGCWSALKIVSEVADGLFTLDADFSDLEIVVPTLEWEGRPWDYVQRTYLSAPDCVLAEADLVGPRWEMVKAFGEANDIDAIEVASDEAWLGIVAVGVAYDTVREALKDLGLATTEAIARAGIRILRVGMPYPLNATAARDLIHGTQQVLVLEEKASFVEAQLKDLLYGDFAAPVIVGKKDQSGKRLVPADGALTAQRLLGPLRRTLKGRVELATPPAAPIQLPILGTSRGVYFCSGCPHNRSTVVPEGSVAGGGTGCHCMVAMSDREDSKVVGITQMGGEGSQWIGQASFTSVDHIFQNMGDGTFFHSGQLAVQACVAAGVNITFKILYNAAVAMTGAQDAEGALDVPTLTRKLHAEGVARIIVCSDDPKRHKRSSFAPGVDVWHRDRLDDAQQILRDTPGVSVLVYDQQCAAEARRRRRRGIQDERKTRVVINEAVCEGCGDCGVKSNCLSVQPVDTEFGRKTRIDQTSCNTDYSCLDGDCPSFITLEIPEKGDRRSKRSRVPEPPKAPAPRLPSLEGAHNLFLAGIGGTGIVTVNQVLGTAATHAGLRVDGLDQTGLSQKAGPVTSHLRISRGDVPVTNRITPGSASCVLAFDALTAADSRFVGFGNPDETITVASTSVTPTGSMVYDPSVKYPDVAELSSRLEAASRSLFTMDALAVADRLFGSTAAANFLILGAAFQLGGLPIPSEAIEAAIEANGVAVQTNVAAFRWGRAAVAHPDRFAQATAAGKAAERPVVDTSAIMSACTLTGELRRLVEVRVAQLVDYQGPRLAADYVDVVEQAWRADRRVPGTDDFTSAVARGMHKFMAYKDEYEVARLLTDPFLVDEARAQVPDGSRLTYKLHPPALRSMGRTSKIGFGPRSHWALRALSRGKSLRGTPFDPFGYARVRRVERALVVQYREMVLLAAARLSPETYAAAVGAAEAADIVRGYEDVKLRNVARYVETVESLGHPTGPLVQ